MPLDPQLSELIASYERTIKLPRDSAGWSDLRIETLRSELEVGGRAAIDRDAIDLTAPHPAGHNIPIRLYRPNSTRSAGPVLIYLHGGGWATGGNDSHGSTARALAENTGLSVAAVDYRLAPENPFPAGLSDCLEALRWIADHAELVGGDGRIVLVGDSAGANLAAAVTIISRDERGPDICFQILIYPNIDFDRSRWPSWQSNGQGYMLTTELMAWFQARYVSADLLPDPRISPIRAKTLENLPPAFIVTAEYDPLRDEGEAYGARLREAGVPVTVKRYAGQIHGFFRLPDNFTVAKQARADVAAILVGAGLVTTL